MSATGVDSKWNPPARRQSSARAVIAAGVVAGLIAGVALAYLLRPSGAEMRAAARSLVPPGAQVITDQEITGHPLVVPHYVRIEFRGGDPPEEALVGEVEEVAREAGWSMTDGEKHQEQPSCTTSAMAWTREFPYGIRSGLTA
ncbi:MAG TPA: YtxH domain-containing protein [Acidimicrobiales bacterium]|nr:YtxH domain-containing protein [Acidimicrobiales bacterium]